MWIVEIAFLHVYYFIFKLKTWYFCEISAVIQAYCHTVGNNHIQAVYNSSGTYKCMPFHPEMWLLYTFLRKGA